MPTFLIRKVGREKPFGISKAFVKMKRGGAEKKIRRFDFYHLRNRLFDFYKRVSV